MGCGSLKPQRRPHAHTHNRKDLWEGRSPCEGNVHETTVGGSQDALLSAKSFISRYMQDRKTHV